MDEYLRITLDAYGINIDGAQGYFGASWLLIGIAIVSVVAYKIYKRIKKGY